MLHEFSRTELLIGKTGLEKLRNSSVAIFGIGGVGTYAVEALARAGVGILILIDDDCICLTNINRQLHATHASIGQAKVEAMRARVLSINPRCNVQIFQRFYLPELAEELVKAQYSYIIDAIDTMSAKLSLVVEAKQRSIPIISSMGAGNKLDAAAFKVADVYDTVNCPLARIMRKELRKLGVEKLKVVYSEEMPLPTLETEQSSCAMSCICPSGTTRKCTTRRKIPGSISFVPAVVGLIIAGEVVKDLLSD